MLANINYPPRNWFALRVTYGRERTAYDYLVSMGVKAFCPMHRVAKIIKGKRRLVMQSRLPNLFFAYGTEEELQRFVYDNTNLPFLRFYYRYYHDERHSMKKEPLIVSDEQIETFRIIANQPTMARSYRAMRYTSSNAVSWCASHVANLRVS